MKTIHDLTDEEILEYRRNYRTIADAAEAMRNAGINTASEGSLQRRLKKITSGKPKATDETDPRPLAGGTVVAPDKRRKKLEGTRFVFTSAQNNTYVHEGFLTALLNFCEYNEAQLIVSPFSYNKNGFQNGTKDDDEAWYDPRITEYFVDESCEVAEGLVFCGELDILPTAVNPLSGFENYTQNASAIFPHTKVQLQSMPRMKDEQPRFLYTTGAVTLRNYIQRKAGQKAEFHHVFGALFVEIDDDGVWYARQLIGDEQGRFYDLTNRYTENGITPNQYVDAIVWGDIHLEKIDHEVANVSFHAPDSILNVLKPNYQFIHDIIDFTARNHHNIRNLKHLAEMQAAGTDDVYLELTKAGEFLKSISRPYVHTVVVESNHDQAFEKWLDEAIIHTDPKNAWIYHSANAARFGAINAGVKMNIFQWAMHKFCSLPANLTFLEEDESFTLTGIEFGMHGHRGPNGARGNPKAFRAIGRKVNTAHTHSAMIHEGVYVAGVTGKLDMGYNKGPSSWSHSHIIQYPNGKRAIITIKDGKWRA